MPATSRRIDARLCGHLGFGATANVDRYDPWRYNGAVARFQTPYYLSPDKSVVSQNGLFKFFSPTFFERIVRAGACFVCGRTSSVVEFSEEHILPRWVLKQFKLFDRAVTLPNGTTLRYRSYVVPCCRPCNALLGRELEEPIQRAMTQGYDNFVAWLRAGNMKKLFVWLCLLFFKTHYKDLSLPLSRDRRVGSGMIGDAHNWKFMHHINSIARTPYTRCHVRQNVLGSVLIVPAAKYAAVEPFDFVDLSRAAALLIRVEDVAVVAVLDDGGWSLQATSNLMQKISGPLSAVQLREALVRLALANMQIESRPVFGTQLFPSGRASITAQIPPLQIGAFDQGLYGEMLHGVLAAHFAETGVSWSVPGSSSVEEDVRAGRVSFLFKGAEFNADSFVTLPGGTKG